MIKIKFINKLLKILLIVLVIFNLGGCMKIGSEKFNNDNKKNYVCIEDYDPQLLVEESPESLQEFVKNHWDVVKEEVNNFTMERYGFRSEPTLFEKTGQIQSSPMVYIKSLDHDNLIFSTPAGFSKETNEFYISDTENDLGTIDLYIVYYLANYAYKEDLEPLNSELNSFIKEKGMYTYNPELENKLGFKMEFVITSFAGNNGEDEKAYDNLLNYFKETKYENYSVSDIKSMIEGAYEEYESGNAMSHVNVGVTLYNNVDNLDTKIMEEFVQNCKNKGIEIPKFKYSIHNYFEMCMYTRGTFGVETSRVVFNNKFEIPFSFNNDETIEEKKKIWVDNKEIGW